MTEDPDFVVKALLGVRAVKSLIDPPVVTETDGSPQRIFHFQHADRTKCAARLRRTSAEGLGESGGTASGPDDEEMTKEAKRDEPSPGPSADVPSKNGAPE